jgi:hypothetical protein
MIRFRLFANLATRVRLSPKRECSLNRAALVAAALSLVASSSLAQTGGSYDLFRNTINGGGATFSTGDGYRLGSTVGQPDAGTLSAGAFVLKGGFWGGISLENAATPTPTVTGTAPSTATATVPPSPTQTATGVPTVPSATPTPSGAMPAATSTPSSSPSASGSPAQTATPSPTATPPACAGDCNEDGSVTVDELIHGVNIALGTMSIDTCRAMDANSDGDVTVDELIAAVSRALTGCTHAATDF